MKQVFRAHRLCEQDGPLGPYIESYGAEMRCKGYAQHTREVQIRLIADFGCWLAKRGIQAQDITAELFRPYLRARARHRRPTRNDLSALQRLLELLRRQGVVAVVASPAATPAERLQREFRLYLRQERALAATTQAAYTAFVGEFLTERFGAGPVDLSRLCAANITRFVRRRASTIQSKRVQLMTTALRSFLRFARYRGDIDKDLAACIPAVANWKPSTLFRALPPDQVEQVLNSVDRKTAIGRRDYAILLILARLGLRAGDQGAYAGGFGLARRIDYSAREGWPLFATTTAKGCRRGDRRLFATRSVDRQQQMRFPPCESARGRVPRSVWDRFDCETHAGAGRNRFSPQRRTPVPARTRMSDAQAGSVVV